MVEIINSFRAVGLGIFEIFLLGFTGFYVMRKRMIAECCLSTMSKLVMDVTLPCWIFASVITNFSVKEYPGWWVYPIVSMALVLLACLLGFLTGKLDKGLLEKNAFTSLVGFQNVGYLPLPLVSAIFPAEVAGKYHIYIFLFLLGYIPLMASLLIVLISGRKPGKSSLGYILNPSFFSIIISITLAGLGLGKYVPQTILNPVNMLGGCTVPLAMIVLGGVVYVNFNNNVKLSGRVIFELVLVKLILLPLLALAAARVLGFGRDLSFILFLEAAMPTANSSAAMAKNYGGNHEFIGQSTFFIYVFSLVTIPLCVGLYMQFFY
jgi:malate permease and related proteins